MKRIIGVLVVLTLLVTSSAVSSNKNDDNQPPVAEFKMDKIMALVNDTVSFDATASYDPDGDDLSYEWVCEEGFFPFQSEIIGQGSKINYTFIAEGYYTITLNVSDGLLYDEKSMGIQVVQPPPVLTGGMEPTMSYTTGQWANGTKIDVYSVSPTFSIYAFTYYLIDNGTIVDSGGIEKLYGWVISVDHPISFSDNDGDGSLSTFDSLIILEKQADGVWKDGETGFVLEFIPTGGTVLEVGATEITEEIAEEGGDEAEEEGDEGEKEEEKGFIPGFEAVALITLAVLIVVPILIRKRRRES